MSGISGEELAREVRMAFRKTKVLIISGFADLEGISPEIARLNKPFSQHELAAIVADLSIERAPTRR